MTRTILILLLAILALVGQTLAVPLFGMQEEVPILVFLLGLLLYLGITRYALAMGVALGIGAELFTGLSWGSLTLPFLMGCATLLLLGRLIDIKPLVQTRAWLPTNLGIMLAVSAAMVVVALAGQLIVQMLYGVDMSWWRAVGLLTRWHMMVYNLGIMIVLVAVFRFCIPARATDF